MGVKRNIFRLGISFSITAVIIFAMVFLADLPTAKAGIDGSNVSPETAYTITPGQTEYLSIDYLDDFDWYKITVDHTCSLVASISNNSGLLRYNVYDSNLTQLSSVYYGVTTTGRHVITLAPGTYYIKLYEYTPNREINYMQNNISFTLDIVDEDFAFFATLGNQYNGLSCNDPVNPVNGNFTYENTDVSIPTISESLEFNRFYNSRSVYSGPLGKGWQHNYNSFLTFNGDDSIQVLYPDGHSTLFSYNDSIYTDQDGCFETLDDNGDGTYTLLFKDQIKYIYDADGKMTQIVDRNNNTTNLQYDANSMLTDVIEPTGRSLQFTYDQDNRISQITDPAQRTVQLTYDSSGNLASVQGLNGGSTIYTYGTCGLETITDPEGNTVVDNTYDTLSRVVEQRDGEGNITSFTYDVDNQQTTMQDAMGYAVTFEYNDDYMITGMLYPESVSENRVYDSDNNITAATDKNSNTTTYTYDSMGNVLTKTDPSPLGYTTATAYDSLNNPVKITDAAGYATDFTYDNKGNLLTMSREVSEETATISYTYNAYGQVASITDANGNVGIMTYDQYGNLESISDPMGNTTSYTYDILGRKLTITTPRGNEGGVDPEDYTYTYSYDVAGNLLSVIDPLGSETSYTYNLNSNLTNITDPRLNTVLTTYNDNDNIASITDALGNDIIYTYDANGNLASITDRNGNVTQYEYDFLERLLETTYPDGSSETLTLDGNGNILTLTDRKGNTSEYEYDVLNRLTLVTDAMGNETSYAYDELGNKTSVTDPRGNTTSYIYDENAHVLTITDALDNTTTYAYDLVGNRNSLTNALGNTWTYEYDDASRLTSITTPLGYSSTNTYDADGNVISATDANGNTTFYEYNAIKKLIAVTNALGNETNYVYDANGNLIEIEDALGHSTTYEYDELNRLITRTNPLNKTVEYTYDDEGNLTRLEKADGNIIDYDYDCNNRLSKIEYPDQTEVHFSYDDNGNRTSMSDEEGTTTYSYDDLNRLTEVSRGGDTISYEYDANSNMTEIEYPDGSRIFYCYTDLNQIESVSDAVYSSYFMYNDIGNIIQEMLSNGIEVYYSYDLNNRLTVLDHVYGEDSLASFIFSLDNMGNPLSITDQDGGTTEYSYDDVYQLMEADYPDHDTVSYIYDAVGNRTSANNIDYTYNDANQLIDVDGTSYSYDDNGCLTSAGNKDYSYDSENRLIEIDDGTNLINFFYDGDGNRIRETVAGAVYKTTEFVYDINFDISRLIAEDDDQGNEYNYIYGNRLLERSGTDGLIFYHQDGLGSTSVVSSVYGEGLLEYDYDAFGNLWDTYGSGYNPMQFTGEYSDESTGLLYLRARYYDPNIGRFITPDSYTGTLTDPLSQNLYVYCGNNPVAYTDPSGYIKVCQWDELGSGLWDSGSETVRALLSTPGALWELAQAIWNGQLSFEDLKAALGDVGQSIIVPIDYVVNNSGKVWFNKPSAPTDAQVYQYGKEMGQVLQMAAGSAGAAKLIAKAAPKAAKALGINVAKGSAKTKNPLANIRYTDKVKAQAAKGDYHGFPESVDGFGANGKVTQITGGDNVVRTKVEIPGSYDGKTGVFEYIIEPDGVTCNHRLFIPNK